MISFIRRRFTYANVAMTLALVFAMTGGAYAAKRYLITSTKQISPKVLKQLHGKAGAAGSQGPVGPAGPQGPAGPAGKDGATGLAGKDGDTGPQGPAGPAGKEGAVGKDGKEGKEGSPWTAGGMLPSGKTETGAWNMQTPSAGGNLYAALSFPIPLKSLLTAANIHVMAFGQTSTECPGSAEDPQAVSEGEAVLCVYQWKFTPYNVSAMTASNKSLGGVQLAALPEEPKEVQLAGGTFAVTEG